MWYIPNFIELTTICIWVFDEWIITMLYTIFLSLLPLVLYVAFELYQYCVWMCPGAECWLKMLNFLHNRPWISPWIKTISNELDIICHVFASQLSGHCDVIANRLWRHQQNVKRASKTRTWCVKILVLASFMDSLCLVRNKIMYVLLWRTVYALTRVLFWCLFPSLLRNSGKKHQNNTLVDA